jgi:hypothetical protein
MFLIGPFSLMVGSLGRLSAYGHWNARPLGSCLDCDGRHVLGLAQTKRLEVWDAFTGRSIRTLKGYQDPIYLARLLPDGKSVLAQSAPSRTDWATWRSSDKDSRDSSMRLWNIDSGTIVWHIQDSLFDAISRDGRRVYGVYSRISPNVEKPQLRCWDLVTGSLVFTMPGFSPSGFLSNIAEESVDGRRLLYADPAGTTVFDLNSRTKLVHIKNGPLIGVPRVAFVGDGDKFFYDSPQGTVRAIFLYSLSKKGDVGGAKFPRDRNPSVVGWRPNSGGFVAFCNGYWMSYDEGSGLVDRGKAARAPFDIIVSPDERSFVACYLTDQGDMRTFKIEGYNTRTFTKVWERPGLGIKCLSDNKLVVEDGDSVSFVDIESGKERRKIRLEGFLAKNNPRSSKYPEELSRYSDKSATIPVLKHPSALIRPRSKSRGGVSST